MRSPTPFVSTSGIVGLKEKQLHVSTGLDLYALATAIGDYNHDAVNLLSLDNVASPHLNHAQDPSDSSLILLDSALFIAERQRTLDSVMTMLDFAHADLEGYHPPGSGTGDPDTSLISVTAYEAITRGQPLYVSVATSNQAGIASCRPTAGPTYTRTQVVGFAETSVSAGQQVTVRTDGSITLSDWTAVAGATTLQPGLQYYLDPTIGMISTTGTTTTNDVLVVVGRAVTPTTLDIEIGERIII